MSSAGPDGFSGDAEWGARALAILGEPVFDRGLAERIAGEGQLSSEERRALLIRSRDLPDWRRPPRQDEEPTHAQEQRVSVYQRGGLDLGICGLRRFEHGLLFRVEAIEPDVGGDLGSGADVMNLSFRIRPDLPHRVRLVAYTEPGCALLTNTAHPGSYPDDDGAPWLAGGASGRGRTEDGISTWGEYFLSPFPSAPSVTVMLSYPEFNIPPSRFTIALCREQR